MTKYTVHTVTFKEMIVLKKSSLSTSNYDLHLENDPTEQNYCPALFQKIMELPLSELQKFIEYQCSLMKDPFCWLNKLEKLIAVNEDAFYNANQKTRFNKLLVLINMNRKEIENNRRDTPAQNISKKIINAETEERIFSFTITKEKLNGMKNSNEKIKHLTSEIYEYKQSSVESINPKLNKYDELCQMEIERIQVLEKFQNDLVINEPESIYQKKSIKKLKLNCNLNIFVDVLYQMQNELKEKGKPYLEATTQDIAEFMVNNFIDKDNQPIPLSSVRTILTPSKIEKRPKADKKIDLNKFIKPMIVLYSFLFQNIELLTGTIDFGVIL